MVKLDLQYDLVNGTPASASPPQANFTRTEQYVNQELLNRDGSVSMNAQLRLVGDPLTPLDAAPKQYVDTYMPVGSMVMFAGSVIPPGGKWLLCDGADLEQSAYPELFTAIGTNYTAAGAAAGHFSLPNLTQRFPRGGGTPGATGGSADNTVVAHTHTIDHAHAGTDTGYMSADHVHGDDHQHVTAGMNTNQAHGHQLPSIEVFQHTGAPTFYTQVSGGGGFDIPSTLFNLNGLNTEAANTDHIHSTNFKSQQGYGTNTGGSSANHFHGVTVPAHAGASGSTGSAATDANLPPYVSVNYLIRAR